MARNPEQDEADRTEFDPPDLICQWLYCRSRHPVTDVIGLRAVSPNDGELQLAQSDIALANTSAIKLDDLRPETIAPLIIECAR